MKEIIQSNYYNFCFLFIFYFSLFLILHHSQEMLALSRRLVCGLLLIFCVCVSFALLPRHCQVKICWEQMEEQLHHHFHMRQLYRRLFIFEFDGAGCDEVFEISSKIHSKYLYAVGSSKKSQKPSNCGFIFLFTLSGKCRTHRKTRSQIRVMYK